MRISLPITTAISLSKQMDKFVYLSVLVNNNSCIFSVKILNNKVINNFLQNFSTLPMAKFATPARTDIKLHKVCINWEQSRCVAHSTLIVGLTIALLISLGTCFVRIQSARENFACAKRLFNLLAEAIINVRNARLSARCAKFLWKFK